METEKEKTEPHTTFITEQNEMEYQAHKTQKHKEKIICESEGKKNTRNKFQHMF